MRNTSKDIIRYFSTVASENPVYRERYSTIELSFKLQKYNSDILI